MSTQEDHLDRILEAVDTLTEIFILQRKESESRSEKDADDNGRSSGDDTHFDARMEGIRDYPQLLKESDMNQFQRMKTHSFSPISKLYPHLDDELCETKEMLIDQLATCNHVMSYLLDCEDPKAVHNIQEDISYKRFHRYPIQHESIIKLAGIRGSELFSLGHVKSSSEDGLIPKGFYFSDPFDSVMKPYLRIRTIDRLKKGHV